MTLWLFTFTDFISVVSTLVSAVVFILLALLPVFYARLLIKTKKSVQLERSRKSIGTLYDGTRYWEYSQLMYSVVFLVRRLIFAIAIMVMLGKRPQTSIQLTLVQNLMYACYVAHTRPHETFGARAKELTDEFILMCVICQI